MPAAPCELIHLRDRTRHPPPRPDPERAATSSIIIGTHTEAFDNDLANGAAPPVGSRVRGQVLARPETCPTPVTFRPSASPAPPAPPNLPPPSLREPRPPPNTPSACRHRHRHPNAQPAPCPVDLDRRASDTVRHPQPTPTAVSPCREPVPAEIAPNNATTGPWAARPGCRNGQPSGTAAGAPTKNALPRAWSPPHRPRCGRRAGPSIVLGGQKHVPRPALGAVSTFRNVPSSNFGEPGHVDSTPRRSRSGVRSSN